MNLPLRPHRRRKAVKVFNRRHEHGILAGIAAGVRGDGLPTGQVGRALEIRNPVDVTRLAIERRHRKDDLGVTRRNDHQRGRLCHWQAFGGQLHGLGAFGWLDVSWRHWWRGCVTYHNQQQS